MSFHVAVIPDGNRRWALARGLNPFDGHRAGSDALETLLKSEAARTIDWFTFWATSIDNHTKRTPDEVLLLNALFAERLGNLARSPMIHEQQVRIRVLGEWTTHLSPEAQAAAHTAMSATASYTGRALTILVAYDGIQDMVKAVGCVAEAARRDVSLRVNEDLIKTSLATRELPPVDLVIRTGGEPHWSAGFMMWETANSQLIFYDRCWPEFTPEDLAAAIQEYHDRGRRFGA